MTTLALFDFDGTITTRDSFTLFLRWHSPVRFYATALRLLPQILLFAAGRYPNERLKEAFLKGVLQGMKEEELQQKAQQFLRSKLVPLIRPQGAARVRSLVAAGARVIVVTASPRLLVEPWCREIGGVEILGTELATADGLFTGKIAGHNCRAEEKVRRIHQLLDVADFDRIEVYGDSSGDFAMLQLADEASRHFKPFRD